MSLNAKRGRSETAVVSSVDGQLRAARRKQWVREFKSPPCEALAGGAETANGAVLSTQEATLVSAAEESAAPAAEETSGPVQPAAEETEAPVQSGEVGLVLSPEDRASYKESIMLELFGNGNGSDSDELCEQPPCLAASSVVPVVTARNVTSKDAAVVSQPQSARGLGAPAGQQIAASESTQPAVHTSSHQPGPALQWRSLLSPHMLSGSAANDTSSVLRPTDVARDWPFGERAAVLVR